MTACWECGQPRGSRDDGRCALCGAPPILRARRKEFSCTKCGKSKRGIRIKMDEFTVFCSDCYLGPEADPPRPWYDRRSALDWIWKALGR